MINIYMLTCIITKYILDICIIDINIYIYI
jgi:hypothetical protein